MAKYMFVVSYKDLNLTDATSSTKEFSLLKCALSPTIGRLNTTFDAHNI